MIPIVFLPGGVSFDVGYGDYFVLDASGSEDPDESNDNAVYLWACRDKDGFDCFFDEERVIFDNTAKINKSVATFLESGQT